VPKIQWERLPREKWAHLRDRANERQISEEDVFELAQWKAQDPDVPEGDWYKDLEPSNCAEPEGIQARFCWLDMLFGGIFGDPSSLALNMKAVS